MHTGDTLVHLLTQMKVNRVFGVPGGQTLPLYDGIQNTSADIRHIGLRAETSAAYAAVAYARVTNKVGVCDATVGPGAAQFTSGLGEAYNSSTPIVALFSDLPMSWEHLRDRGNASQGMDQLEMVKPFTKWAARITSKEAMPDMVRNAFLKAVSGRPGPTALSIHEDIFKEAWEGPLPQLPASLGSYPRYRTVAERADMEQAVRLLADAQRPVILAGGGAMLSRAEQEMIDLAEHFTAPVLQTFTGRGVMPDSHPLNAGMVGGIGTLAAKKLAKEADVVFLVGFKSSQNSTFTWEIPTDGQRVIHLDIDESEIGRVVLPEVGLVGDAKATLAEMVQIAKATTNPASFENRLIWIQEAKTEWDAFVSAEVAAENERMKPQQVLDVLNQVAGPNDILVCDASFSSGWGGVYYNIKKTGRHLLTPRGLAGLGFGLPAAIGAAAAETGGEVYLLAGDGGFGYTVGELAALQENGLKVNILIIDNRSWGWMEWLNKLNYEKEYFDLPAIDFAKVSEGFGLAGYRARNRKELAEALHNMKKSERSSLVHIDVALWETPVLAFREAIQKQQGTPVKYM
jgi:acetolactate synthase-1/2/3 large subunit